MHIRWENLPPAPSVQAHNPEVLGISASGKPLMVHLQFLEVTELHQVLYSLLALLGC